jgi:hypothetical protein
MGKPCRGHRSSAMYRLRMGLSGCLSSELREHAHSWSCCPVVTALSVSMAGAAFASLAEIAWWGRSVNGSRRDLTCSAGRTEWVISARSTPSAGLCGPINRAIDFGRAHADLPVWLIAASQGSIAAVSAAAHLCSKISGAVLASSVTRPGRAGETLLDADLGAIVVPVLVVNNQYDSCRVSPPGDAPNVLAAPTHSPRKELVMVGSSRSTDAPTPAMGCRRTAISGSREWWCSVSPTGSERLAGPEPLKGEVWNPQSRFAV